MDAKVKIYREKAEKVIENLKKRNMNGIYCENSQQAVEEILKMIPDHVLVGLGGSETIIETGLVDALRGKNTLLSPRVLQ